MDNDWSVGAVNDADFEQVAGRVGADEHREAVIEVVDEDRMVEGVDHVVVADAVLASARGDQRRIHGSQVSLENIRPQVTLPWSDGSTEGDSHSRCGWQSNL